MEGKKKHGRKSHAPSVGCVLTVHSEIQKAVNSTQNPKQRAAENTETCCSENNLSVKNEKEAAGDRCGVPALRDTPPFVWTAGREVRGKTNKQSKKHAAFDASRLLEDGTWPPVGATIELYLHLSRRKQLCSAERPRPPLSAPSLLQRYE